MSKAEKYMMGLMIEYFKFCQKHGYVDFDDWCSTDIYNEEHTSLVYEMREHCNALAGILCH